MMCNPPTLVFSRQGLYLLNRDAVSCCLASMQVQGPPRSQQGPQAVLSTLLIHGEYVQHG